jgi:N-methylhydantoinase B
VQAGASARIYTGGGGGWGDPLRRAIDQIDADLADGLITRAAAEALYGVVVDDVSGRVDRAATALARATGTVP